MANSLLKIEKRLMIVSSDELLLPTLKFLLSADGYEVIQARDLNSVWQCLQMAPPQAFLLDLHPFRGDALEILKLVKHRRINIPAIALVESICREFAMRCIEAAGVASYITRPIDYAELRQKLQAFCAISNGREARSAAVSFGPSRTAGSFTPLEQFP